MTLLSFSFLDEPLSVLFMPCSRAVIRDRGNARRSSSSSESSLLTGRAGGFCCTCDGFVLILETTGAEMSESDSSNFASRACTFLLGVRMSDAWLRGEFGVDGDEGDEFKDILYKCHSNPEQGSYSSILL